MMRRVAVVGDQLDTGGQIEHYEGPLCLWGDGGHQVALIGGSAYCETCKSMGVIAKAGGPRRIQFMGETAADGDIVLCHCATPPRIVAKLAGESWCDDEDYGAAKASTSMPQSAVQGATYDEQFTLLDAAGRPLRNTYYTIRLPTGELVHGVADGAGNTARYKTEGAHKLAVYLGHREA